ncbi:hypothetical protein GWO62_05890 [Corynebacterium macginleyi]|uniref:hypothetical protein n=1 Tax=Corynebacterium macginleyi TaxID=38290 RepID=UPI00190BD2C9|nr:hypothetical protein [Corynebacterium macginleyi]MBK4152695.1 hypothetical protein [Corynebacterium macginleyi]
MKKLLPILAATTLIVTGCSSNDTEENTPQTTAQTVSQDSTQNNAAENTPKAVEGDIQSELGKLHGGMCDGDLERCEVNFTIDDITKLDTCDADKIGERPEGTSLYRVDSTVTASPDVDVDPNYEPSDFLWAAQWSTLNEDGENEHLEANQECISPDMTGFHWGDIRRGDMQTYTMYFNIPEGSDGLRLTVDPNRWFWELPA